MQWGRSVGGKEYRRRMPEYLPRGAPGRKRSTAPLDLPVPYMAMDEAALLKRNWQAYLDNKGVAEVMWGQAATADRMAVEREAQRKGEAWHYPIHPEAVSRY